MPHQVALTIVAHIRAGEAGNLDRLLRTMGDGVANNSTVDFASLEGVHFARFVLVDETTDLQGNPLRPLLIYMADLDLAADRHLGDLVDEGGTGIDELFGLCDEYPGPGERTRERRLAYLKEHRVKEAAFYVNTAGRTREQIRQESKLRDDLETFLDSKDDLRSGRPEDVRLALQEHVAADDSLRWVRKPPPKLELGFRVRELVHMVAVPSLVLLISPLLLLAAPIFLIVLRLHERSDHSPHLKPPAELVQELATLEDHLVHNPFTAIGMVKPGLFRKFTLRGVLFGIDYATRHVFNRGNLAGVKTIHFARWVFLDDNRRVIFASNYDGSLESYMDDFIDKIAIGLNIVFSNGFGYPRTRWLIKGGARDELAFKDYLRLHQVPTRVWFSAYGRLTNLNIATDEQIRAGLFGRPPGGSVQRWVETL
ncbi:MAG: hypothetical protein QOD46_7 [Actinomycetota bacterium]|nr:hypothetical protein [Actinomycetota bacterium]